MRIKTNAASLPIVEVTWVDAVLDNSHNTELDEPEAFGGLVECQDVGYLVRYNSHEIVLAVSRCIKDNDVRHSNSIPKSLIQGLTVLAGELPCPLTYLVPKKVRKSRTATSHPGSSNMPDPTSPSTTASSSTQRRSRLSNSSSE